MNLRNRIDRLEKSLQSHPAKAAKSRDNTAAWLELVAVHIRDAPYAVANLTPAQVQNGQSELQALAAKMKAGKAESGPVADVLDMLSNDVLRCLESILIMAGQSSPAPATVPLEDVLVVDGIAYRDEGLKEAREAMARAWASAGA